MLLQYYNKYFRNYKLTSPKDLIKYLNTLSGSHRYCILTLRAYLNFLVETDSILLEEAEPYFRILKNKGRSHTDNYVPTKEEVRNVFDNIPEGRVKLFYEVLTYSGIRITELYKLFSEFERNRLIIEGGIAKYPLNYIRGQKKIFYVYLPIETANRISRFYKISSKGITKELTKTGLNPKYLRKFLYNFLIYNNVPESVADFIEGRATQTVGSLHYLSKTKQADFWYSRVVEKLRGVLYG